MEHRIYNTIFQKLFHFSPHFSNNIPVHLKLRLSYTVQGIEEKKLERVCECCLKRTRQLFSYIMMKTCYFSMRWWWSPLCNRPTRLVGSLVVVHGNNSPRVAHGNKSADRQFAPLRHIILIPNQPICSFTLQCCVLIGLAANTHFLILWFDPTAGHEPALKASKLTITPPMWLNKTLDIYGN